MWPFGLLLLNTVVLQASSCRDCGDPAIGSGLLQKRAVHNAFDLQHPAREDLVLYGHIHMAKTGGSSLNGELALNYERICGLKGYSYDYFQAQERYKHNPVGIENHGYRRRLVVAPETMDEIGYEDCDFVSQEDHWYWWRQFASWKVRVELHLPCRDPIDHLLSNCNYANVTFNCEGDLVNEISRCLLYMDRFSNSLNGSRDFPNFNVKCFRSELTSKYIEYMGTRLQRKRFQSTYAFRPTNKARNKRYECLWQNESAKLQVENYLKELDYYKFCNKCIDSPDDLLADDVSLEGGDYSE